MICTGTVTESQSTSFHSGSSNKEKETVRTWSTEILLLHKLIGDLEIPIRFPVSNQLSFNKLVTKTFMDCYRRSIFFAVQEIIVGNLRKVYMSPNKCKNKDTKTPMVTIDILPVAKSPNQKTFAIARLTVTPLRSDLSGLLWQKWFSYKLSNR